MSSKSIEKSVSAPPKIQNPTPLDGSKPRIESLNFDPVEGTKPRMDSLNFDP